MIKLWHKTVHEFCQELGVTIQNAHQVRMLQSKPNDVPGGSETFIQFNGQIVGTVRTEMKNTAFGLKFTISCLKASPLPLPASSQESSSFPAEEEGDGAPHEIDYDRGDGTFVTAELWNLNPKPFQAPNPMTTETPTTMKTYELINSSDPYTFKAPDIKIAAVVACLLSTGFGARQVEPADPDVEQTPILFGWNEWLSSHNIDDKFIDNHLSEIADAYDSFLIGGLSQRKDAEEMLEMLPAKKREEWKANRQDRHRSSMNQIGETAAKYAKVYRLAAERKKVEFILNPEGAFSP
jgi:hypothetical protein